MKTFFFTLLSLFSLLLLEAQNNKYISSNKEGLAVRLQTSAEQIQMEFKAPIDSLSPVLYLPNNLSKTGVKLSYEGIGLAVMFKSANYGKNPELYGKTKQLGLKLAINQRKWGLDFSYQRLKGFYLDDPGQYRVPQIQNLDPVKRQDIISRALMVSAIQIFNSDKFSYRMQTNQNEIQKKNAGSFLLKYNFISNRLSGDTSFIPRDYLSFFSGFNKFKTGLFNSFIVQPGYTHTFVFKKKLSFNIKSLLGWGAQRKRLRTADNQVLKNTSIASKFDVGFSIMYFETKFFMGLTTDLEIMGSTINKSKYNLQNIETLFFIGYRFKKVKIFPKFFDKLNS